MLVKPFSIIHSCLAARVTHILVSSWLLCCNQPESLNPTNTVHQIFILQTVCQELLCYELTSIWYIFICIVELWLARCFCGTESCHMWREKKSRMLVVAFLSRVWCMFLPSALRAVICGEKKRAVCMWLLFCLGFGVCFCRLLCCQRMFLPSCMLASLATEQ